MQGSDAATRLGQKLFASLPVPALSLAVARGDEMLWQAAFGMADLEFGVPATSATFTGSARSAR